MIDVRTQRALSSCFYLSVPLVDDEKGQRELFARVSRHEKAVTKMLKGEITPDDLIDATSEFAGINPDVYLDELEENLETVEEEIQLYLPLSYH
jgi:hypothetical protein